MFVLVRVAVQFGYTGGQHMQAVRYGCGQPSAVQQFPGKGDAWRQLFLLLHGIRLWTTAATAAATAEAAAVWLIVKLGVCIVCRLPCVSQRLQVTLCVTAYFLTDERHHQVLHCKQHKYSV